MIGEFIPGFSWFGPLAEKGVPEAPVMKKILRLTSFEKVDFWLGNFDQSERKPFSLSFFVSFVRPSSRPARGIFFIASMNGNMD
jgi:hypothetical protein